VIARPRLPFQKSEAKALGDYLQTATGRLMVLLEPFVGDDKKMARSGLEELLETYGVGLPAERILSLPIEGLPVRLGITDIVARINPKIAQENPLAKEFSGRGKNFPFHLARPVQPNSNAPAGRYQAQALFVTVPQILPSFADDQLGMPATQRIEEVARSEESINNLLRTIKPLPVAVVVTENAFDPSDPHAGMRPGSSKPRLLVYGMASFASNPLVDADTPYFAILASSIEWLRERPANIGIEPKKHDTYAPSPQSQEEGFFLFYFPPVMIVLCLAGLATGVWTVRRR
jgi:hypothetical protein